MSLFVELEDGLLINASNIKTVEVKVSRAGVEQGVEIDFMDTSKVMKLKVPFASVKAILTAKDKALPTLSAAQVRP